VKTATPANYKCSAWESSHTFSFTFIAAALAIQYFSWKHAYPRSMFCDVPPDLGCCRLHLSR